MKRKFLFTITARLLVACIFATGVAFSDSLRSAMQYGAELEKKQASLGSIKEDSSSIEDAFKNKMERASRRIEQGQAGSINRREFSARELSSMMPASPQPGFNIRTIPNGTLSPQGSTGVINRGINKKGEDLTK